MITFLFILVEGFVDGCIERSPSYTPLEKPIGFFNTSNIVENGTL
jgi:hypothetical protein